MVNSFMASSTTFTQHDKLKLHPTTNLKPVNHSKNNAKINSLLASTTIFSEQNKFTSTETINNHIQHNSGIKNHANVNSLLASNVIFTEHNNLTIPAAENSALNDDFLLMTDNLID